jgi:hypothetical protein
MYPEETEYGVGAGPFRDNEGGCADCLVKGTKPGLFLGLIACKAVTSARRMGTSPRCTYGYRTPKGGERDYTDEEVPGNSRVLCASTRRRNAVCERTAAGWSRQRKSRRHSGKGRHYRCRGKHCSLGVRPCRRSSSGHRPGSRSNWGKPDRLQDRERKVKIRDN